MNLVVVGSMAFDKIETPFGSTDKIVGGAATYIALSASYMTNGIGVVSVVGNDFPTDTITGMNRRGIDTQGVDVKQDGKTFFWHGRYHNDLNSRDSLATELNVLGEFNPVLPGAYRDCHFLMLGNLAPQVQKSVIEQMNNRPKVIAMDTMNFWMDIAMPELKETISMVDLLIINDEEARQLSGEYSLIKAARVVREMGPKTVVIKKGEHGALLFHEDKIFFGPALPLEEVFDPTGAGDTFAGGFMGYIADTEDLSFDAMKRALIYGSALASFCVERFGTERLENLNDKQIEDRVNEFARLVHWEGISQLELK